MTELLIVITVIKRNIDLDGIRFFFSLFDIIFTCSHSVCLYNVHIKKVTTNFDSLVKQILRNQTNIKNGNFVNDWKKKEKK